MKLGPKKNKRDVPVAYLVAAALLVAGAVVYMVAVRPLGAKSDDLQAAIDAKNTEIATLQRQLDQPQGPKNLIKVADLVELAKAMPDDANIAQAILELDAQAKAAGVAFTAIAPGSPQAGSGFTRVPLSLSFVGSYYDLTELVYRLRQLVTVRDGRLDATGPLFTIDSVNWHEPALGEFPSVQADLVISTYVYGTNPALLPGGLLPGTTTPASTTPGSTTPASTAPGATTAPGETAPATTTPAATTTEPAATAPQEAGAQQAAAGATP
jgi:Tfp pilus assembly protein PilO